MIADIIPFHDPDNPMFPGNCIIPIGIDISSCALCGYALWVIYMDFSIDPAEPYGIRCGNPKCSTFFSFND